ncbi:hypothetical protein D9619_009340 [Psilocybe cf. subviscida]|uniref:DUF8191 domain-containing protein n=1 Tax=Psilocybe cf. subviscida TaxID=2480587 RepID=A0A8H5BUQ3_9AGAR|nr:hypothetical protein D9619_009340 [Psilocybe cf. subviscida]
MNLNVQISALETKLKQRDARILKLRKELREAHRFIHELTRSTANSNDDDMDLDEEEEEEGDSKDDENEEVEDVADDNDKEEEQDADLPQVLILDDVYVCCSCGTEVLEGLCHSWLCGMKHQWPPEEGLDEEYSVSTTNLAIHPDRSLVPRGDTPLGGIDPNCNPSGSPPEEYHGRKDEYLQLLQRGATRLMCETFHLEFTHTGGIYAWADADIFDEFSGPLMKQGHFWKIHLGRRIRLEEDDIDGSVFIESLLEDAVVFPMRVEGCSKTHEQWETKQETRGVWVTRLKAHIEDPEEDDRCDASDSDRDSECGEDVHIAADAALEQPSYGGAITLNEYLPESDDEVDLDQAAHIPCDDFDDDDDYGSPESEISDSDDQEVCDPAFQLASMFGPDKVWSADEDEDDSEDEDYDELGGQE